MVCVTDLTPNHSTRYASQGTVSYYNFQLTQLRCCCRQNVECRSSERGRGAGEGREQCLEPDEGGRRSQLDANLFI